MSTDIHEHLGQLIHVVAKAWRQQLDQRLKPLGLTRSKWLALIFISRHAPGVAGPAGGSASGTGITQRALAEKMEIGEPAVVALLDRMEKDRLLVRNPMPGDRRARSLALTEEGQALISKIEAVAHELREELLTGFPADQLDVTSAVLANLKQRIEEMS